MRGLIATAALWVSLSLLLTSGHMGSADAGEQFRVAHLVVARGAISLAVPPPSVDWVQGRNGRFYEAHDIGNSLVMLAPAAVGRLVHRSSADGLPSRGESLLTCLLYSLIGGLGLTSLTVALRSAGCSSRQALAIVAITVFATLYGAYQKIAYDVFGAAIGTCFVLAALMRLIGTPGNRGRRAVTLGLALAFVGLFRSTFAPFLALGVAIVVVRQFGPSTARRPLALIVLSGLAGSLPGLAYNALRTGNPLKLPITGGYSSESPLSGNLPRGLWLFVASPDKGLLFFSPILILAVVAVLDRRVRARLPAGWPAVVAAMGAYAILMALQRNRDTFGWGARYLLPIVPCLMVTAAPLVVDLWRSQRRWMLVALLVPSLAFGTLPILTAWNDDLVEWHGDPYAVTTMSFRPESAVLHGVATGLSGADRYAHGFVARRGVRAAEGQAFPDLWWVNGLHRRAVLAVASLLAALCLAALALAGSLLLIGSERCS